MRRLQQQDDVSFTPDVSEADIGLFIRRMQVVGFGQDRLVAAIEGVSAEGLSGASMVPDPADRPSPIAAEGWGS